MADYASDPLRCIVCDQKFFSYGDLGPHEHECLKAERARREEAMRAKEEQPDA